MGRFPKVVPCLLAVALVLSAADLHGADEMATRETAKPAAQKPLIALARAGENRGDRGPLYHQILQEAFLATAREEFGAATYDGTLREPTPQSSTHNVSTWEVIANFDPRRPNFELILNRRPGENSKRTWKHKLSIETPRDDGMEKEAARAEQAMHREFFDALRADGLTPRPHAWHEAAAAPKEVEPLLCNFCLPAQFDAIRKMHAQIDEDGESPERLAALARAYANLGLLTEHLWTNSTKALTARSLVYAERLCAKQPESAAALRCRGYVRALAGRQHTALVDFQGARALAEKDHAASPTWGVLAEALCKFDAKTLKEDLEKPYQPLARWLYYLALEPSELPSYLEDVANSVLEVTPDAYRPIDLLTNKGLWIQRTEGAKFGHLASRQFLYPDMAALDDLPPEVKAICLEAPAAEEQTYAEFAHRASLVSALRNADSTGQRGEPAWAALATCWKTWRWCKWAGNCWSTAIPSNLA